MCFVSFNGFHTPVGGETRAKVVFVRAAPVGSEPLEKHGFTSVCNGFDTPVGGETKVNAAFVRAAPVTPGPSEKHVLSMGFQ